MGSAPLKGGFGTCLLSACCPAEKPEAAATPLLDAPQNTLFSIPEELPTAPLVEAARNGNVDECREISVRCLQSGLPVDVNCTEPEDNNTALHVAAEEGHAEIIQFLIEMRANTELKNGYGHRPIDLAEPNTAAFELLKRVTEASGKTDRRYGISVAAPDARLEGA
eukprot:TRINITY_DN25605_c0_g1_i1.p1 TRINITY_DN25605_c0_g1~~TRINITY_DN25605_c0_g1_i1.p1  ORF type:complete len:166 (+),score=34.04 TRINITY_DN25605_c0_g1_i1:103-600(+)